MPDNGTADQLHIPVLLHEVLLFLAPEPGNSYLDLTAGYGGHAARILERTGNPDGTVLVDRDIHAVQALQSRFGPHAVVEPPKAAKDPAHNGSGPQILHTDFGSAAEQLLAEGRQFDVILADLGVSSPHLDQPDRGFSLAQDGPLDMRMDPSQELTAADIVNGYSEDQLIHILQTYGEEPKARAVARAIIAARPISSTTELAAIVARQWRGRGKARSKVHPATRTFQAIRIAVNDELGLLEKSLPKWINLLTLGGRIAIVSFQSLEDRIIKQFFIDKAGSNYDSELRLLTKRPITAESTELVHNPRSRSAKLRAAVKINN